MQKRYLVVGILASVLMIGSLPVMAADNVIKLNSPRVLGTLHLDAAQLKKIRKAIIKSLNTDVLDTEFQCGEERMDCVVRSVREWTYKGDRLREVVVNVHTVGNDSITIRQHKGKWPKISIGK